MPDDALRVGQIGKMPDADDSLLRRSKRADEDKEAEAREGETKSGVGAPDIHAHNVDRHPGLVKLF